MSDSREYQRDDIVHFCRNPEGDWLKEQQASFCTGDTHCQAAADEHDLDCPVEQQLHDEIGF